MSNEIFSRSEMNKLKLRKIQIDDYLEKKRFKPSDNPIVLSNTNNSSIENIIDFKELNINNESNISEIFLTLKQVIDSYDIINQRLPLINQCVISLRKITCRDLILDNNKIISNKIYIILFKILDWFKQFIQLSDIQISTIVKIYKLVRILMGTK